MRVRRDPARSLGLTRLREGGSIRAPSLKVLPVNDAHPKNAGLRALELCLLGVACFYLIPPVASLPEPQSLVPDRGLAFAGTAFLASLGLAYRRGAENVATVAIKLAGFLAFGWAIYLRCTLG